jgi:hypothetical protein
LGNERVLDGGEDLFTVHDVTANNDGLGGSEEGEDVTELGDVEADEFPGGAVVTNSVEAEHVDVLTRAD